MSVGKYLPGASFSIFAVRDDVIQCKMNSYWSTLVLKVCLAPPPIIDKRDVLNTRQCSAMQWSNYWSNLSNHQNVNWHRSDLLTHFAFLLISLRWARILFSCHCCCRASRAKAAQRAVASALSAVAHTVRRNHDRSQRGTDVAWRCISLVTRYVLNMYSALVESRIQNVSWPYMA